MWKLSFSLIFALIVAGCGQKKSPETAVPQKTGPQVASSAAFAPVVVTVSEETKEGKSIMAKAESTLKTKKYDVLEATAAEYRTTKACFPNGHSKLACLYEGLSGPGGNAADSQWTNHIQELAQWAKERPDSITARIALAQTWIDFAWKARGHDFSDKVPDESWQLFSDRTTAAHTILQAASKIPSKCPMYWFLMQRVALNEGWKSTDCEALFQDAVKNNPGVFSYYFAEINYLLPRWYGQGGDWEAFAEDAANKIGGDDGDVLYARLAWDMKQKRIYDHLYKESKMSWPRAKRGFEILHKRLPGSLSVTSEYCIEAGMMEEKQQMRTLFNELAGRVDLSNWFDQRRFEAFRDWAFDK